MRGKDKAPDQATPRIRQGEDLCVAVPRDTSLEPLVKKIREKHGDALLAILVYGSWLRGKRDTMLDFYVLLEDYRTLDSAWQGWMCRLLPPNVYHIHHQGDETDAQAFE